jgi:hypothetical protein
MKWYAGVGVAAAALLFAACAESPTATQQGAKRLTAPVAVVIPGQISQSNVSGACQEGEWHWIINGLADESLAPDHITVYWDGGVTQDVPLEKFTGGTAHYTLVVVADPLRPNIPVASGTELEAPYATAILAPGTVYNRFNLSHQPCDGGGEPQGASIVTTVHDPSHVEISNASPAALGVIAHDTAVVSSTPAGGTIPAGSTVTFFFWKNNTCTGTPESGPDEKAISGTAPTGVASSTQGPLGAGEYSFKAYFNSGNLEEMNDSEGECEPFKVNKGSLHISTTPHDAAHNAITAPVALGSIVHDRALVTGEVTGIPKAAVQFTLYTNGICENPGTSVANLGADNGPGTGERSASTAALGAGSYSYLAVQPSDDNYTVTDDTGCEPFTVSKGTLHISTDIHLDPGHTTVTSVTSGSSVHDRATVTGEVAAIPKAAVTFTFYLNSTCDGAGSSVANTGADNGAGTGVRSASKGPLAAGAYAFHATQPSDANYDVVDDTPCEPLTVIQLGKTMGYWGNTNGIARIVAAGGYGNNGKAIGRGSLIDTQAEAAKVFPNTLNACGKGTPSIFTVGAATATKDCTVATGINTGTLNTNSAQTLALAYNIGLVSGFTGQTLGALGCGAYAAAAGLTSASTVNDTFTAAVALIDKSYSGAVGATTQTQLGNMNLLLNCLNREA